MAQKQRNNGKSGRQRRKPERNQVPDEPTVVRSNVVDALKFDASNIYFNNLPGTKIYDGNATPGILTVDSTLNLVSRSDMLNVSATSIYTYVRHANSGRANYESSDYMIYLIAMSEIYVALTDLTRAYGIATFFDAKNLYSEYLLQALGYDPKQFRSNMADIRYSINVLINKTKAFAVPQTFNFFEERMSEFSTIHKDGENQFSQYIVTKHVEVGVFDPTTEGGGSIQFEDVGILKTDVFAYIARLNEILDAIRANEDMNIMSGDTLKAYGDNLFRLVAVEPELALEPVYDALFLAQLQNAHVPYEIITHAITQRGNKLHHEVGIVDSPLEQWVVGESVTRILNSEIEAVDANIIFALSKYQIVVDEDSSGIISGNINVLSNLNTWVMLDVDDFEVHMMNQVWTSETDRWELAKISKFKQHPFIYIPGGLPLGDFQNVASISAEDTNRMNDARFILAFQTPQMG